MGTSTPSALQELQVRIEDAAQMARIMERIEKDSNQWRVCSAQCKRDLRAALRALQELGA